MYIIYCAVCIAYGPHRPNKKYIGQSRYTLAEVIERHFRIANTNDRRYFYNALRCHQRERFCWGVIDTAKDEAEAIEKETNYIRKHRTWDNNYGYNNLIVDEPGDLGDGFDFNKKSEKS